MFRALMKPFKKAALAFLAIPAVSSRITRCSDEEFEAIKSGIPNPETKEHIINLKGWEYKSVTSKASSQMYYYYHMSSKKEGAPTFVLVHGLFLDARMYVNFHELASDFELVAPELPFNSPFYHGQVEDFPNLLQDFLDAMGIERMYLGGVSLGGQIAMMYMVSSHKTPVDGLALFSTNMVKSVRELRAAQKVANQFLKITHGDERRILPLIHKMFARKKRKADESEQEVLKIFAMKPASFYRQVLHTALNMKEPPDVRTIKAPTLIVLGDSDTTMPFESAKHLVELIPDAEMKVIKNAEHNAAYTHGSDIVKLIREKFVSGLAK